MKTDQPQFPFEFEGELGRRSEYRPHLPRELVHRSELDAERREERDAINAILFYVRTFSEDLEKLSVKDRSYTEKFATYADLDELQLSNGQVFEDVMDRVRLHYDDVKRGATGSHGQRGPLGPVGPSGAETPRFKELEEKIKDVIEMLEDLE